MNLDSSPLDRYFFFGGADGDQHGQTVSAAADGSALVAGFCHGGTVLAPGSDDEAVLECVSPSAPAESGMFLASCATDGGLDWVTQIDGDWVEPHALAARPDGGAVLSGTFHFDATFGPGETTETSLSALGDTAAFVADYAADGSFQWVTQAGGESAYGPMAGAEGVAFTSDGSTVAVGRFAATASFGSGEPTMTTSTGDGLELFVALYDPLGALVWARREGGAGWDGADGVAMAADDAIFAVGTVSGAATYGVGDPGETDLTSWGLDDALVMRLALDP
jgi:hypothetical protein